MTEQVRALARQYRVGQQPGSQRAAHRRPPRARFTGAPAGPAARAAAAPVQLTLL